MMTINDLDHEFEERLEITHNLFRRPVLCKAREVSDVEKHYAHFALFAAEIGFECQQLVHHDRRYVFAKGAADPITFLNRFERAKHALSYLDRYQASRYPGQQEQKALQQVRGRDRKSTRLNSSHGYISYAVFC